jgi:hypothetical protein
MTMAVVVLLEKGLDCNRHQRSASLAIRQREHEVYLRDHPRDDLAQLDRKWERIPATRLLPKIRYEMTRRLAPHNPLGQKTPGLSLDKKHGLIALKRLWSIIKS